MRIYHGTSERAARVAMTKGLAPRSESGVEPTWEDHPSSGDYVYLTTAYAGYFAMNATPEGERWAIVEVDTDLLPGLDALAPDEDFLEQASRSQELPEEWGLDGASMADRTAWFRENLCRFAHLWEDSIAGLGNCSHKGVIPPEAITRVSFVDPKGNRSMSLMASDPCITLLNYQICRDKYQGLVRWFMGDVVDASAFILGGGGLPSGPHPRMPPELQSFFRLRHEQSARLQAALANRAGVEVVSV